MSKKWGYIALGWVSLTFACSILDYVSEPVFHFTIVPEPVAKISIAIMTGVAIGFILQSLRVDGSGAREPSERDSEAHEHHEGGDHGHGGTS